MVIQVYEYVLISDVNVKPPPPGPIYENRSCAPCCPVPTSGRRFAAKGNSGWKGSSMKHSRLCRDAWRVSLWIVQVFPEHRVQRLSRSKRRHPALEEPEKGYSAEGSIGIKRPMGNVDLGVCTGYRYAKVSDVDGDLSLNGQPQRSGTLQAKHNLPGFIPARTY